MNHMGIYLNKKSMVGVLLRRIAQRFKEKFVTKTTLKPFDL